MLSVRGNVPMTLPARRRVKNIRKQDATIPLTLIAADSMDEYNKPDLSHVISQG
ncbi:hypothetical protein WDK22_26240, partial [Escherichia coli]